MRVSVTPDGEVWSVTALDGPFRNTILGTVEGISLQNVTFRGEVLSGIPVAVWGATLQQAVLDHAGTMRRLLVAKESVKMLRRKAKFDKDDQKYVNEHGFTLNGASWVNIVGKEITWS